MIPRRATAGARARYQERRRFGETPEAKGRVPRGEGRAYVIQMHAARRLHYDFRLELDGVLKSWAVTKGPSLDPAEKRLAVRTADHPLDYASFEGTIPEGSYGAGTVLVWDRGSWTPEGDPHEGLRKGKLVFTLDGERLKGRWVLVRFRGAAGTKRENWLLIKLRDEAADRKRDVRKRFTTSVATGRTLARVAKASVERPKPKQNPKVAKAGKRR